MEYTSLRDVVDSVSICFDPDEMATLIEEDKPLMAEYNEFQKLVEACNNEDFEEEGDDDNSKWIIRMELNKESMLDKHISMDDIHFAVSNSYNDDISCVYSDMNADKLVFRIRLTKSNYTSKKHSLDQSDEIYKLKNFQNFEKFMPYSPGTIPNRSGLARSRAKSFFRSVDLQGS